MARAVTPAKPVDNTPMALQLPPNQRQFLQTIKLAISQQMTILQHMLPKQENKERFISNIMTAIVNSKDGKLFECTPQSILNASREAVEFGLSLNPQRKQADLIPVWNGRLKCLEAQFRIRYGGLMTLALRSGEVKSIKGVAVRERDHFIWEEGLNEKLEHRPALNGGGALVASYCIWTLANDKKEFRVADIEDINRAKKSSQSKNKETGEFFGPWKDDEEEMWIKTAVHRASKYMPSSAEDFQKAVQLDTLRDIGHEAVLEDGEIIDVTETVPQTPTQAAKGQLDKLETKVAPKPATVPATAPQPPSVAVDMQPIPRDEAGEPDYAIWIPECVAALTGKSKEYRTAWRTAHEVLIDGGEMTAPDQMGPLIRVLNS